MLVNVGEQKCRICCSAFEELIRSLIDNATKFIPPIARTPAARGVPRHTASCRYAPADVEHHQRPHFYFRLRAVVPPRAWGLWSRCCCSSTVITGYPCATPQATSCESMGEQRSSNASAGYA